MWFLMMLIAVCEPACQVTVAPAEHLQVEVGGEGPPVVLLPGLFGSAFGFRHITGQLQERGYRTIVVEPLGIGRSSRPRRADYSLTAQSDRIAAVLDSIGVTDALFLAHSMGASMALRLGYRRPDLMRGLISLDGGAAETVVTPSFRRALRLAPLLRLVGGRGLMRRQLVEQLTSASGDPGWITSEVIEGYAAAGFADLGRTLDALQGMARAREPEELGPRLADIQTPILLLVGTAPRSAGLAESELARLQEQLPALIIERLSGVGHYIHEEAAAAVIAAVARFDGTLLVRAVSPATGGN
ncbi:MAG TPA: alpha/beta hydrolase [Longimicrobiales bacterium]|nr:alpha/beta hydrolase [Longimicrobiales bacterium]